MIQLLQRSGINEKKSLLARVLFGKELAESCGVKLSCAAGSSLCLVGSPAFPAHVVLSGSLRCCETSLSLLEYIDTERDNVAVLAVTDSMLVRLDRSTAATYLKQYRQLLATLTGCMNQILGANLPAIAYQESLRLVRRGENDLLLEERDYGRTLYVLLEGSCRMSKQVECLSSEKQVEVSVHSQSKRFLLGEEALYGLAYRFSYHVESKFAFLIEGYPHQLSKVLPLSRVAEMKLAYQCRYVAVRNVQERLMEFPCEQQVKLRQMSDLQTLDKKVNMDRSQLLKASLSLTNFKGRQYATKISEATSRDLGDSEAPLKFYFEDNAEKVKFELINKGYRTVEAENYLRQGRRTQDLFRLRVSRVSQLSPNGKEYLVPIFMKLRLRRHSKIRQRIA